MIMSEIKLSCRQHFWIVFCNNIIQSVNQLWFPERDVRTTFLMLLRITRTLLIQIEPMISACQVNITGW